MLATLAPFSDEIAVYPSQPMPDASRRHALSFCIPMDTPGLKFICRDSVSLPDNRFDHPLSGRFDEQDAFVIFDNVEVPRHRVFINGNLPVYNSVMSASWRANAMHQTMIRAWTKLEFAWGIACRMAEAIGASDPATLQMLAKSGASPNSRAQPSTPRSRAPITTATAPGSSTAARWMRCARRCRTGSPG